MDMTPYWRWRSEGNFWESVLAFYLLRQGFSWFLPHSKLTKVRVIVLTPLLHRSTEFIDVSHFVQLLLVIPLGMRANKLSSSDWSKETLTYQDILLAVCIILNWFFSIKYILITHLLSQILQDHLYLPTHLFSSITLKPIKKIIQKQETDPNSEKTWNWRLKTFKQITSKVCADGRGGELRCNHLSSVCPDSA